MNRGAVALACLVASVAVTGASHRKEEVVQPPPLQVIPAGQTLVERLAFVHAALLVRVAGPAQSRAVDISGALQRSNPGVALRPVVMVVTESDVVVLEAFKSHGAMMTGARVRIATIGGRAKWGGRDLMIRRRAPDLEAGATYLVMLRDEQEWETPMFVDDDVFRIEGGRVAAPRLARETSYAKELAGLSETDAIEHVRRASGK